MTLSLASVSQALPSLHEIESADVKRSAPRTRDLAQAADDEELLWSENAWDKAEWGEEQELCVCAADRHR